MAEESFYLLPPLKTIAVDSSEPPRRWIGRIVKSYSDPVANYTPQGATAEAVINEDAGFRSVEQIIDNTRSKSARLQLADMFTVSHSRSKTQSPHFETSRVVHRIKLRQEEDYLTRVLGLDEVKVQMKKWHRLNAPVFLIVGLLVADQINYAEFKDEMLEKAIEGKPPSGLVSLAVGSPVPMPDVAGASISKSLKEQRQTRLTAIGKRIFAIEYRVLTKRLLSMSGQLDMRPGGIRGDRSFGKAEDTMNEVVEEQQTEVFPDPDPLAEVIDDEDVEEYCFNVDD
ncbi:MAG: hypothetical protein Q9195_007645 [Heterodermia aff. obscurata]